MSEHETVPPRWRFENIRQALRRLQRTKDDRYVVASALDDLAALEESLLPKLPTIPEFLASVRAAQPTRSAPRGGRTP